MRLPLLSLVPFALSCAAQDPECRIVGHGALPASDDPFSAEVIVDGLAIPWSVAFVGDDALVTERDGRLRLIEGRTTLRAEPLLTFDVTDDGEGGLLGVAHDPARPDVLFTYRTTPASAQNVIERVLLARDEDGALESAAVDSVVLDGIPANQNHDGGRLRIGPDGALWASTGDAQEPQRSRDLGDRAGKILRLDPDEPGVADVVVSGVRNSQGFAFLDDDGARLVVTDHGPSGEFARLGHDELNVVDAGGDVGWPDAHACDAVDGVTSPLLVFDEALPPGSVAVIDEDGATKAFVTALGARKLIEVDLATGDAVVHLDGTHGRLRDIVVAPDGSLWVTTSNCDGRGTCPPEGDAVLRLTR
jgi:glucose/arabinose dehydrogenase